MRANPLTGAAEEMEQYGAVDFSIQRSIMCMKKIFADIKTIRIRDLSSWVETSFTK